MTRPSLDIRALPGIVDYRQALKMQRDLVAQRRRDAIGDTLLLLQHAPVITLGNSAAESGVLATDAVLRARGIAVVRTERGGQATYHGPGQVVGYPIVHLHRRKWGAAAFVARLEEIMIRAAAFLGVNAVRRPGMTGVFAARPPHPKVGALGIRITAGVTYHGFALNADMDLEPYSLIVPCGLAHVPVSSLSQLTGRTVSFEAARDAVIAAARTVFDP